VEVAVCVNGESLFIAEAEAELGGFAGIEILEKQTLFGFDADPLNVMLGDHGVVNGTYIDSKAALDERDNGQMLFNAGFDGVGDKIVHLLAAAEYGNTLVLYHADLVSAMAANIELCFHFLFSFIFG